MRYWDVLLDGKLIDMVGFQNPMTEAEVLQSLIDRGEFPDGIVIKNKADRREASDCHCQYCGAGDGEKQVPRCVRCGVRAGDFFMPIPCTFTGFSGIAQ